jgi:putative glutamine amidotransferase
MRPRIGITLEPSTDGQRLRPWRTGHALDYLMSTYSQLVRAHGGLPVLIVAGSDLSEAGEFIHQLDGLLLSGGADLDPSLWGEAELEPGGLVQPLGPDEKLRSKWEDALVRHALEQDLPLFGICRGLQQLNVSLGGSLWQDLERQTGRAGHPGGDNPYHLIHGLDVTVPSEFSDLMGAAQVTSSHHQGLRRLGRGLRVLATAQGEPNVVEAARHEEHDFVMGVQWHPERMAESPLTHGLFRAFLHAVEKRRP